MENQEKTENKDKHTEIKSKKGELITVRGKDGRFKKGNMSGAGGRPCKQTLMLKQFMKLDDFIEINAKAIEMAKAGDQKMIELFLKSLIPNRVDATIYCDGWDRGTTQERLQAIIDHVNAGILTPIEGERLSNIVDKYTRSVEVIELANKIDSLIEEKERRESENV